MGKSIKEIYNLMGENYDEVIGRIGKEERLHKYLLKFLENTEFDNLEEAVKNNDIQAAFSYAHTLKGLCLNFGFGKLYSASAVFCDNIRDNIVRNPIEPLFDNLKEEYEKVLSSIRELLD